MMFLGCASVISCRFHISRSIYRTRKPRSARVRRIAYPGICTAFHGINGAAFTILVCLSSRSKSTRGPLHRGYVAAICWNAGPAAGWLANSFLPTPLGRPRQSSPRQPTPPDGRTGVRFSFSAYLRPEERVFDSLVYGLCGLIIISWV